MTQSQKPELLPCPFCGGVAKLIQNGETIICMANCGGLMCDYKAPDSLISAWNTRADGWQTIESAPRDRPILLNLGETVPDRIDIRSGEFVGIIEASELGYDCPQGGWLIWNESDDFFVIPHDEPLGWADQPEPPKADG